MDVESPSDDQISSQSSPRFTWKQGLALAFAIILSVSIILAHPYLGQLQQYGYLGVFIAMALSNATLILPAPGFVVNMVMGSALGSPFLVGIAAGLGSTLGEVTGYAAGYSGSGVIQSTKLYTRIHGYMQKYGMWVIFILALVPNPFFDLAGFASGALGVKWWKFLLATAAGKTIRAIALAYLGQSAYIWWQS